jgi:hypothetical protein
VREIEAHEGFDAQKLDLLAQIVHSVGIRTRHSLHPASHHDLNQEKH